MSRQRVSPRTTVGLIVATLAFALSGPVRLGGAQSVVVSDAETLGHFQAILRLDSSNPPGNERRVVDYVRGVLEREGIETMVFALEPDRPNLVARLRGSGAKRPLLLMGHTDVVTVDPEKWTFPPFSATRDGGYVYGRGALDDKPSVAAGLVTLLALKRQGVALDRDVIFLAEAGEEGTTRVGIDFMVDTHFDAIDAEYCLAEGGGVRREGGRVQFGTVGVLEKIPRTIELIARGPAAHGSVPRDSNAVTRLARAVTAISRWQPPVRLNETTREYFRRLATMSPPDEAARLAALLSDDEARRSEAISYFEVHEPTYVAMVRASASPTIIQGGQRYNVVPSEATATIDVRLLPDDDADALLATLRAVVDDPAVEIRLAQRDGVARPAGGTGLDTEAFRVIEAAIGRHYGATTIPVMSTGASDKAQVRAKGVQCYGIGPAGDVEESALGFGAHSDQERIREADILEFVRFYRDVVIDLAGRESSSVSPTE